MTTAQSKAKHVESLLARQTLLDTDLTLPATDREAVSLALQGHTVAEICSQLNRPQRSVYRLLERIKKRLQSAPEGES